MISFLFFFLSFISSFIPSPLALIPTPPSRAQALQMDAGDWEQPPSQICELKRGLSHHMRLEKGRDFYPYKAKAMFANNMNLLCKCYEIFWQETNSGGARYINEKKKIFG